MARMFKCKHCGRLVNRNPRIKSFQRYCRQKECQQARKNAWELVKIKTDESYRQCRQASKKRWRRQHSAHTYQCRYREKHPDYVAKNREKQKKRNEKPKTVDQLKKIVKTDALLQERLINPGLYALLPWDKSKMEKIVKTDALMVQLTVLQDIPTLSQQQLPVL
ncbi:hypothetical protein D4S03_12135 [bacterium]|nr:MAG: hypothetical protein D4S03_12135 [bacterium]